MPRPCLENGQLVSWATAQTLQAQALQRRQPLPGLLDKDSLRDHPCKLASIASKTATPRTVASESSRASATFPTSPAQAPSMPHCRRRSPNKRLNARLTTKDLSSPGTYQHCTAKVQRLTKRSTPVSCTATPMLRKEVLAKTCTPTPALGQQRARTGLLRRL